MVVDCSHWFEGQKQKVSCADTEMVVSRETLSSTDKVSLI